MTLRPALAVLALLVPVAAAAAPVPTLPPSALHPGDKALVRTVFAGDSVETFDAEIVGVLPGGRVEGDLILARATSPRVEHTGIAAGMSGSPVYVDGRLIGALSSGWTFTRDPIFGITPIGEMLAVLQQPESPHADGTGGPSSVEPGPAAEARLREYAWDDAPAAAAPQAPAAAPEPGRPAALPLPLAASGLDPRAFAAVRDLFSPSGFLVTPGGRAPASHAPAARAGLEPGDAVAVDVLRGDLNFSAIGTVTWRDGDRVLLFGHPFFQSGEVRLPLSRAEITTVVSSLASSFKLGVPGEPVGVATQDRRAAVAGRLGGVPRLLPFAVDVALPGAATRAFHFQTIEDRALAPQLVSAAALNSLLESGGSGPEQTVRWTLDLWRQGRRLTLADVEAGEAPFSDVLSGVGAPLRFLFGNPYERLRLDSLRVRLEATPGREQWTLRQAAFDRAAVRPGGTLAVAVEVERWRGPRRTLALRLPVPEELPDGHYVLHLAGGPEYDRFLAQRLPARFRPVSLDDAWRRLAAFHASDAVYAALWARAPEITQAGEDYPELPTSALPLLTPPGQSGDRARRGDWALVSEARVPVAGVLRGELVLDVDVDSKAP